MMSLTPVSGFLLAVLGVAGFLIASYILRTKTRHKALVCPLGHDCDAVVHSKYNALFGIPNEALGLLYYGAVILFGLLTAGGVTSLWNIPLLLPFGLASLGALCMSIALTYIQVAILHHYCTWCLASAGVNVLIVGVELTTIFFT